jgi:chromosome segregation ATPase
MGWPSYKEDIDEARGSLGELGNHWSEIRDPLAWLAKRPESRTARTVYENRVKLFLRDGERLHKQINARWNELKSIELRVEKYGPENTKLANRCAQLESTVDTLRVQLNEKCQEVNRLKNELCKERQLRIEVEQHASRRRRIPKMRKSRAARRQERLQQNKKNG